MDLTSERTWSDENMVLTVTFLHLFIYFLSKACWLVDKFPQGHYKNKMCNVLTDRAARLKHTAIMTTITFSMYSTIIGPHGWIQRERNTVGLCFGLWTCAVLHVRRNHKNTAYLWPDSSVLEFTVQEKALHSRWTMIVKMWWNRHKKRTEMWSISCTL